MARRISSTGEFDLVVAGGLFDYLPGKAASSLIAQVCTRLLKPGGRLFFTNVSAGNPYRPWMEYLANWVLIERSEQEILQLYRDAGLDESCLHMRREETGLTILCEITRPADPGKRRRPCAARAVIPRACACRRARSPSRPSGPSA